MYLAGRIRALLSPAARRYLDQLIQKRLVVHTANLR